MPKIGYNIKEHKKNAEEQEQILLFNREKGKITIYAHKIENK